MAVWSTNNFIGGMNDCIHPSLLKPDTAAYLKDVRLDNGKLCPALRNSLLESDTTPSDLGHYGGPDRSVVQWYGRHYWSLDNATVGVRYGTDDGDWDGEGTSWSESDGNALGVPHCVYDNAEAQSSGNPMPSFAIGSADEESGGMTGDYKYCLTLVDRNGFEGAPGSLTSYFKALTVGSIEGEGTDNEVRHRRSVTVSLNNVSLPANILYAKVWRTLDHGADFYLVGTISGTAVDEFVQNNNWTLVDKMEDSILLMRDPLTSTDNDLPPENGRYLCESLGVFFLAVGTRLHFSRQDNPHAWPTLNFIGFDEEITGIAPEFSGVLVFTRYSTWRVTGAESHETISRTLVPGHYGCSNHKSISAISNAPIWVSGENICLWNGESIEVVTHGRLAPRALAITASASRDDKYYLFLTNGALVYDRKAGGAFYWLSTVADYAWRNESDDQVYLQVGSDIQELGGDNAPLEWSYVSPYIGGTDLLQRVYRYVTVSSDKATSLTVYLEDREVLAVPLPAGRNRVKLPLNIVGRWLQLKITGKGELSEIAVIYGDN